MGCVSLDAEQAGEFFVALEKLEERREVKLTGLKTAVISLELTQEEYDIVTCLCVAE